MTRSTTPSDSMTPSDSITRADPYVWYASYGSNMCADRFGCYLAGGRPPGSSGVEVGCRDPRPPQDVRPLWLEGSVYFAYESARWNGGIALYDPLAPGRAAARAYLVSAEQLADVVAQEMNRTPGTDLDVAAIPSGGSLSLGPGRYETVVHCGDVEGAPVLTFTAPCTLDEAAEDQALNAPSAAYLRRLAAGLREAHAWDDATVVDYVLDLPGTQPAWTRPALVDALAA